MIPLFRSELYGPLLRLLLLLAILMILSMIIDPDPRTYCSPESTVTGTGTQCRRTILIYGRAQTTSNHPRRSTHTFLPPPLLGSTITTHTLVLLPAATAADYCRWLYLFLLLATFSYYAYFHFSHSAVELLLLLRCCCCYCCCSLHFTFRIIVYCARLRARCFSAKLRKTMLRFRFIELFFFYFLYTTERRTRKCFIDRGPIKIFR